MAQVIRDCQPGLAAADDCHLEVLCAASWEWPESEFTEAPL
jgi:hypothetical protein